MGRGGNMGGGGGNFHRPQGHHHGGNSMGFNQGQNVGGGGGFGVTHQLQQQNFGIMHDNFNNQQQRNFSPPHQGNFNNVQAAGFMPNQGLNVNALNQGSQFNNNQAVGTNQFAGGFNN